MYRFNQCDACNGTGYDANAYSCEACQGQGEIRPDTPPEGWPVECCINEDAPYMMLAYSAGHRDEFGALWVYSFKTCELMENGTTVLKWRWLDEADWRK